jgi:mannose-6-phosphate isomerase-like protein (cupin superfamily)
MNARARDRAIAFALGAALAPVMVVACHDEKVGSVAGPPLTIASSSATASAPSSSPLEWTSEAQPVQAAFVDLGAAPTKLALGTCEQLVVTVVRGTAAALGESLAEADVLLVQGEGSVDVTGQGLAVLAAVRERPCDPSAAVTKKVVRGSRAPELVFAGGTMTAHLDAEKDVSPFAYVGRLSGTAPVAEHAHPGAWEILCAVEASGTFTLAGESRKLGPRSIVMVPPDTKHSWQPDPGSKLVAVQLYDPPGPEQRFKALAAQPAPSASADAGK